MASKRKQQEADRHRVRMRNVSHTDPSLTYLQQQRQAVQTHAYEEAMALSRMDMVRQAKTDAAAGLQAFQTEAGRTAALSSQKERWVARMIAARGRG
jgi:hypothetical protein